VAGRPHGWHLGRPSPPNHDSIKLVEASLDLYIRILVVEFTNTTLYL
jgi:hypothetical protein